MMSTESRLTVIRLLSYQNEDDDKEALGVLQANVTVKLRLPPLNFAEIELRKAGATVSAIRAYRERICQTMGFTPGLKESKDLVETIAKDVEFL